METVGINTNSANSLNFEGKNKVENSENKKTISSERNPRKIALVLTGLAAAGAAAVLIAGGKGAKVAQTGIEQAQDTAVRIKEDLPSIKPPVILALPDKTMGVPVYNPKSAANVFDDWAKKGAEQVLGTKQLPALPPSPVLKTGGAVSGIKKAVKEFDPGNIKHRLEQMSTGKNSKYASTVIQYHATKEALKIYENFSPELVSVLPDDFILTTIATSNKGALKRLAGIEKKFTAEGIKNIIDAPMGTTKLLEYINNTYGKVYLSAPPKIGEKINDVIKAQNAKQNAMSWLKSTAFRIN
ncbi:MAG: hypothetical protein Q4F80_00315 [bacterium]|nr:hypothetical protein [bacterium]